MGHDALVLAQLGVDLGEPFAVVRGGRVDHLRPGQGEAERGGAGAVTSSGLPSTVRSATPRSSSCSAAARIRSSLPSGSTMCRRSARARSNSTCSNISGVIRVGRETSSRSRSRSWSTLSSNCRIAVAIFRSLAGPIAPRTLPTAATVS